MINLIFETIWSLVSSDGGDGTGMIFCTYHNYKEISKLFENWISVNKSGKFKLVECNNYDLISNISNENFIITSDKTIEIDFGIYIIKI